MFQPTKRLDLIFKLLFSLPTTPIFSEGIGNIHKVAAHNRSEKHKMV